MTLLLNGLVLATKLKQQLVETSSAYLTSHHPPRLAIIVVGQNPASQVYVKTKQEAAQKIGFQATIHRLAEETDAKTLSILIERLNNDPSVHGILLQLPLPAHLDSFSFINQIVPHKDVDGLNVVNAGRLFQNQPGFIPCTPLACLYLIQQYTAKLAGKNVVIVGRSMLVGRPLSFLLLNHGATVTMTHTQTHDLKKHTQQADIVVSAIGRPHFFDHSYFNEKACLIDVGINRLPGQESGLVGDLDFNDCVDKVAAITPVPGGVGPLTVTYVLLNLWQAYCEQTGISPLSL